MSITCEACGLSYAGGRGLRGVLAQPRRVADPRFLRMLAEVPRFHRAARALLEAEATEAADPTWGEFLAAGAFSDYFVRHFALPLVACVWSCGDADAAAYPARHLFRFLDHHGMLTVHGSPTWRTVTGGSATYVDRLAARLPDVRRSCAVTAVIRHDDGVDVRTADDQRRDVRPRRRRHPRRPGPAPPRRCHRRPRRRTSAPSPTRSTRPGCTGTPRCCPLDGGSGVVELPGRLRPPGPRRARRRSRGELLDEPAARTSTTTRTTS